MPTLAFIHPADLEAVWYGDELGTAQAGVHATGFDALDAVLPGGGWPVGAMTEILHAGPETFAWPLLLPALGPAVRARCRPVLAIGAPHPPFGPALAAQGLSPGQLLWVRSQAAAARLWACEQALRCADVAGVLAWLPQARPAELRRLQLAAAQHDALLWVFRPLAAAGSAAPARLRLRVEGAGEHGEAMALHVLKRRGPPLDRPLHLPAAPRLATLLAASRQRAGAADVAADQMAASGATVVRLDFQAAAVPATRRRMPAARVRREPHTTKDGDAGDGDALAGAAVAIA